MISYHIASTWQLEVPLQVMQLSKAGKTCRQGRWKRPTIWLIWDASPVHPIKPPWTVWRSSVFCCWYVRVHELLKTLTIQNFSVVAAGPHDCSDSKTSDIFPWMLENISSPRFDLWNTQRGLTISFRDSSPWLPCFYWWHGVFQAWEAWSQQNHSGWSWDIFFENPWGWQNS